MDTSLVKWALASIFVGLCAMGCGGGDLNPAMAGVWGGATTLSATGMRSASVANTFLWMDVEGDHATVITACPNGDGEFVAVGHGDEASWSGLVMCAPFKSSTCETMGLTLTSAALKYEVETDSIQMEGRGTITGCGFEASGAIRFDGAI